MRNEHYQAESGRNMNINNRLLCVIILISVTSITYFLYAYLFIHNIEVISSDSCISKFGYKLKLYDEVVDGFPAFNSYERVSVYLLNGIKEYNILIVDEIDSENVNINCDSSNPSIYIKSVSDIISINADNSGYNINLSTTDCLNDKNCALDWEKKFRDRIDYEFSISKISKHQYDEYIDQISISEIKYNKFIDIIMSTKK